MSRRWAASRIVRKSMLPGRIPALSAKPSKINPGPPRWISHLRLLCLVTGSMFASDHICYLEAILPPADGKLQSRNVNRRAMYPDRLASLRAHCTLHLVVYADDRADHFGERQDGTARVADQCLAKADEATPIASVVLIDIKTAVGKGDDAANDLARCNYAATGLRIHCPAHRSPGGPLGDAPSSARKASAPETQVGPPREAHCLSAHPEFRADGTFAGGSPDVQEPVPG